MCRSAGVFEDEKSNYAELVIPGPRKIS